MQIICTVIWYQKFQSNTNNFQIDLQGLADKLRSILKPLILWVQKVISWQNIPLSFQLKGKLIQRWKAMEQ